MLLQLQQQKNKSLLKSSKDVLHKAAREAGAKNASLSATIVGLSAQLKRQSIELEKREREIAKLNKACDGYINNNNNNHSANRKKKKKRRTRKGGVANDVHTHNEEQSPEPTADQQQQEQQPTNDLLTPWNAFLLHPLDNSHIVEIPAPHELADSMSCYEDLLRILNDLKQGSHRLGDVVLKQSQCAEVCSVLAEAASCN